DSKNLSGDLENLPSDLADWKRILEYHPNERDKVRRKYLMKGPYQPRDYTENKAGSDAFVTKGFDSWNKTERLRNHVGAVNNFHNSAMKRADNLMKQGQSICHAFYKQEDASKNEYNIRLNASINACHDESVDSTNKGNFVDLVKYTAKQNELVSKVVLENAPKNNEMVSHEIQTEIVHCFAEEITESVIQEIDHGVFYLLVDESADVSDKEQMVVVFRFVDKHGIVKESFIGIVHNHQKRIEKKTKKSEFKTGKWLNQELSFQRLGKTRWGSHYKTLLHLVDLFPSRQANDLLKYFHIFYFVFYLQLMLLLLGLTNNLSKALQRKDLNILNSMSLVKSTKQQLYKLRNNGWESFINKLLVMEDEFIDSRKPKMKSKKTIVHHYKLECFYIILDTQIQEFNDCFDEFYSEDFSHVERVSLEHQLGIYIDNIRKDKRFLNFKDLGDFARVMVETKKHLLRPLVYRLLKLVLTLPVATATVERCFSGMKIVKTVL
ncbi:hypothetical protein EUTSA_v10005675mg, partial [Eutrema salsugineum]